MKDEYLINYNLFCKRKKFSLYSFMLKNREMNYTEIMDYFRNLNVTPPSQQIFDKIINKIKEEEEKNVISNLPTITANVNEEKSDKEIKQTKKTKRKNKRNNE